MDVLAQIRKPVEEDLARYLALFEADFEHENPLLHIALQHIRKRQGKRLRPILMLLVARAFGVPADSVLHASVSIEELHTASLVHDDIVDESDQRRGQASVNTLLSPQAAVLVGDYLLSKSLQHSAKTHDIEVVNNIAVIGQLLADGELLQLYNISSEEISEEPYFEVIKRKTASLFRSSAQIGALLSGATPVQQDAMRLYGEYLGTCFQIRDDIFDYESNANVGKPLGNDMREGKLTLPLIHAILSIKEEAEKSSVALVMRDLAMKVRRSEATEEDMFRLVDFAKQNGGVLYAYQKMEEYAKKATEQLALLPDSDAKDSLRLLSEFVIQRKL